MEFEINHSKWNITEISQEEMDYDNGREGYYTHGFTSYSRNTIYINKTSLEKVRTLKHELTHVWLYMYGHCQDDKQFSNEDVCEIVASINNFINEIVNRYLGIEPFYHCDKDLNNECDKRNCGFCTLTSNPKYAIRKEYSNEYKSKH